MGGLGNAASVFSVGPLLGVALIIAMVPETRGRSLEDLALPPAEATDAFDEVVPQDEP
jgi:hypothetical protein